VAIGAVVLAGLVVLVVIATVMMVAIVMMVVMAMAAPVPMPVVVVLVVPAAPAAPVHLIDPALADRAGGEGIGGCDGGGLRRHSHHGARQQKRGGRDKVRQA
jgi:hypothetical protein